MSARIRNVLGQHLATLRHEPTAKRVRADLGGTTVVDSTRAVLVWEPRRVVPTYAVPVADVHGELVPAPANDDLPTPPVLDPRVPFGIRSTEGRPVTVQVSGSDRTVDGFLPSDPDLDGLVILDFQGFDRWREEEDDVVSHPHDPYARIDVLNTARHVEIWRDGELLADTHRAKMVFETMLPPRYYLPAEDVTATLEPSATHTVCAYKGTATYQSARVGDELLTDLAWTYEEPLADAAALKGYLAFFDERVDVVLDGVPQERPVTPWS